LPSRRQHNGSAEPASVEKSGAIINKLIAESSPIAITRRMYN
jgi:hypothetical protein